METMRTYAADNKHLLLKRPKDVMLHQEVMEHTFTSRRLEMFDNPRPVMEVLEEYPSLKQFVHVSMG